MIGRHAQRAPRRGATAVVMVVVMLLATMIVLGAALSGGRDQHLTVRRVETIQSMYAAEAGMNMAIRELVNDTDEDGDGGVGTISDDDDDGTDPSVGSATVSVTTTASGDDTLVVSVGTWGEALRRVEATLTGDASSTPGLSARYFVAAAAPTQVADINWAAAPDATGTVTQINIASSDNPFWGSGPADDFGAEYTGKVEVTQNGNWTFYTESDDGSRLWINGTEVVDNDYQHAMRTRNGSIVLTAGKHDIKVRFFERGGNQGLIVSWTGPGVPGQTVIPSSAFTH